MKLNVNKRVLVSAAVGAVALGGIVAAATLTNIPINGSVNSSGTASVSVVQVISSETESSSSVTSSAELISSAVSSEASQIMSSSKAVSSRAVSSQKGATSKVGDTKSTFNGYTVIFSPEKLVGEKYTMQLTGATVKTDDKYLQILFGGKFPMDFYMSDNPDCIVKGFTLKDINGKEIPFTEKTFEIDVPYTSLSDISTLYLTYDFVIYNDDWKAEYDKLQAGTITQADYDQYCNAKPQTVKITVTQN